jgi:hypothetical protein
VCSSNGTCQSGYCDIVNRACTVFCSDDSQCGAGNICGETLYLSQEDEWLPNTCLKPCQRNADCPVNPGVNQGSPICFLTNHIIGDYVTGACQWVGLTKAQLPNVIRTFGDPDFDPQQHFCDSGYSLVLNPSQENICSRGCITNDDCAPPYPTCGNLNATNPSMIGSTPLKACTK